jgi:molybdenum cofactor synthesis domain-containing protein
MAEDSRKLQVAIVTVSDRSYSGMREDSSGPKLADFIHEKGQLVVARVVVPDEEEEIIAVLLQLCKQEVPLIVTTGGTGLTPRDVTPEATRKVIDKEVPGLCEEMRRNGLAHTRYSLLSRSYAGTKGKSLIINLPGSPKGAVESLESIWDVLPHAVKLLVQADDSHTY